MTFTSGGKERAAASTWFLWVRCLAVIAVVSTSLTAGAPPSAASIPDGPIPPSYMALDDNNEECRDGSGDLVPAAVSTEVPVGEEISLDALFLLDGVTKKEARAIIAAAQGAYEPLQMTLQPRFKRFPITPDGVADDGQPTGDFVYLLDEMRKAFPTTPEGFDVVHLVTAKDVIDPYEENRDGTDALAGVAACVGGIRFEGMSLSVGEAKYRYTDPNDPGDNFHAVILAHEIGHLLGAHHHYSNCSEGTSPVPGFSGSCTVMSPLAAFSSVKFGTLEARVVRGYAESYATP